MTSRVPAVHREVRLASRPEGPLEEKHLEVVEAPVPAPGQLLVRNRMMSVTAVMHTLMHADADLPMPPYEVGEPLWGPAVGEVVTAPEGGGPAPGAMVMSHGGGRVA